MHPEGRPGTLAEVGRVKQPALEGATFLTAVGVTARESFLLAAYLQPLL